MQMTASQLNKAIQLQLEILAAHTGKQSSLPSSYPLLVPPSSGVRPTPSPHRSLKRDLSRTSTVPFMLMSHATPFRPP
eukprot:349662-Chlamydomonas_euryale.AAC.2